MNTNIIHYNVWCNEMVVYRAARNHDRVINKHRRYMDRRHTDIIIPGDLALARFFSALM